MTAIDSLFQTADIGGLHIPNRVFMAPLTRNRAHSDGVPGDLAATYYAQRASAGLIISEATQISAMGKGYVDTPGIYSSEQVAAWGKITDAVHEADGRIFCQLWHVGRISHVSLLPEGRAPVSASAIRAETQTFTAKGFEDCSTPEALTLDGIAALKDDYRHAAQAALDAGFDGVELHAANGYLLDQFLQDHSNKRDDAYGGSIENRIRLVDEMIDVLAEIWSKDRIGIRLSPLGQFNDMGDSDPEALFSAAIKMIEQKAIAYLHVVEKFPGSEDNAEGKALIERLRAGYSGFYIANGYTPEQAAAARSSGEVDAVAFGRAFLANPDLPARLRQGAALNDPDHSTFYGGDHRGYTDYPFLDSAAE
ncbi:MAG: alkene reductase [Pseudomonadota bacterium]